MKASTFSLLPDASTIIWVCEMSTTWRERFDQTQNLLALESGSSVDRNQSHLALDVWTSRDSCTSRTRASRSHCLTICSMVRSAHE